MKVRATKPGYYNHILRKTGEVFELSDPKYFSHNWMEKVENKGSEENEEKERRPRGNPNWRR